MEKNIIYQFAKFADRKKTVRRQKESRSPLSLDEQFLGRGAGGGGDAEEVGAAGPVDSGKWETESGKLGAFVDAAAAEVVGLDA